MYIPADMKFKGWKKYVAKEIYHANSDSDWDSD